MDLDPLYREIVETSADGIWVVGLDGRLQYANRAVAGLLGLEVAELVGTPLPSFLDDEGGRQFGIHLGDMRRGHFHEGDVDVQLVRPGDRQIVWVLARETPLYDGEGNLTGVLHRMTDFSDRRRMLAEISESRQRLAEAERIARMGNLTWHLGEDVVTLSDGLNLMLGRETGARTSTRDEAVAMIHDSDQTMVQDMLERAVADREPLTFRCRVRAADGMLWVRCQAEVVYDDSREVTAVAVILLDVSETVAADRALRHRAAQNLLMETVARTANEASTLGEVIRRSRELVLASPMWARARGFDVVDGVATPYYFDEADRRTDEEDPETTSAEAALVDRAVRERQPVWDRSRTALACPVVFGGRVVNAFVVTSARPLKEHEVIEQMGRQIALQLARVSERELAARALGEARDAAMAASQQKSAFLAVVSHEIRTPLNGVIGLNELLLRSHLDPEQRRLVSGIELSGRALLTLINDILDFSKIEAGALQLEQVDFDLRAVIERVVAPMLTTARSKGLAVELVWDGAVPQVVNADPTRLSQVLANLLSNAIKFTTEGTVTLAIETRPRPGGWDFLVEVVDTGIGVDEDADSLFEPFRQADSSTTRVYGGTGLGLAICREIVTAFGGEIGVASESGKGSRFWFDVPLAHPAGGPVHGRQDMPTLAESASSDTEKPCVLVVEDNPVNQMVAVGLLNTLGYAIETADDGIAALEVFDPVRHQGVLMDLQMPRLDGLGATAEIRRREGGGPRTPIIAMTATAVDGERERCLAAGMDDFLTKPVDPEALAGVLSSWLGVKPAGRMPSLTTGSHPGFDSERDGVDYSRLDMLRDMDPDSTAYLDKAIGRFVTGSQDWLDAVLAAVKDADVDALRFSAHKLAGSAGNLGLLRADRGVRALEHLADSGTTDGAADLLGEAEESVSTGRELLLAYQAAYSRDRG